MLKHIPLAAALFCASGQAFADSRASGTNVDFSSDSAPDSAAAPARAGKLAEISVYSSRIVDDIPSTATVITRQDILDSGARNIKDVLRDEVDVVVRSRPGRFNATTSALGRARNESINIRGIEGNRVLIVQDGIRLPAGFSFGPAFQTGRGDYWDVDSFRKIEILRGANATQYGADSLAGVVSATTLGPSDLVKSGTGVGGFAQTGYAQQDNSFNHMAGIGFIGERWQGMFMTSLRRGHELWTQENDKRPNRLRTAPDPANVESRYQLGKLALSLDSSNRLQLTLESLRTRVDTNVLSSVANVERFRQTRSLMTTDTIGRRRASLEYTHEGTPDALVQQGHVQLYWQQASSRQWSRQTLFGPMNPQQQAFFDMVGGFFGSIAPGKDSRVRDNTYQERTVGINAEGQSMFRHGGVTHHLSYGIDVSRAGIGSLLTGTVPPSPFTLWFPHKTAPDSNYVLAGAFIQDEIGIGKMKLIPGLRYDYFRINPTEMPLTGEEKLMRTLQGVSPAIIAQWRSLLRPIDFQRPASYSTRGRSFTPRLGLMWELSPAFVPYFNYAKGFRAPQPSEVNVDYVNAGLRYIVIGNPDLRPERVTGMELGVRGHVDGFRYALSAFSSRYTDFLNQRYVRSDLTSSAPLIYQTVNDQKAHLRGLEARTEWDVSAAWRLNAAIGYTRGDVMTSPQAVNNRGNLAAVSRWEPLNTVQPMRAIVGARYRQASWGAYANVEHSWGKTASRVSGVENLLTQPFTVVNVGAHIKPWPGATVTGNIENLFNANYQRWSDVGGVAANDALQVTRHSASPRSLSVTLRYAF